MKNLFVAGLLFLNILAFSQSQKPSSQLGIHAEIPVQIGIGFETFLSKRISVQVQGGVLTEPNSTLIISSLEALGTDPEIILMIENTFKFGIVGELGVRYNFKKNYAGAFFQNISLSGNDTPTSLIESYYDVDLSTYPTRPRKNSTVETSLTLRSQLYQVGVLYGRRLSFKNPRWNLNLELGISKNIASSSELSSENKNLEALSAEVEKELDYWYSNYAYVPSLTVVLAYSLKK